MSLELYENKSAEKLQKLSEICEPIKTIVELLKWTPNNHCNWPNYVIKKARISSFKIKGFGHDCHKSDYIFSQYQRIVGHTAPKTIFCHDFKGGYLDDRFTGGSYNPDTYAFFHWAAIDTFIYFSHHLVTIPPLAWINAGHRNGVNVLGTFITENEDGEKIWKEWLSDKESIEKLVEVLVEICHFYRFDGYLINIENPVDSASLVLHFVKSLKVKLAEKCGVQTQVIWYDAVTIKGELKWQNRLNELNKDFFDVCDGIFLNYTWTLKDLKFTASLGDMRTNDVYVGVDVFGRNCYGGGGFNTNKALEAISIHGLSVALFAPAWTFECCPVNGDYLRRENFYWSTIWEHLYIHGPSTLPFATSFSVGKGDHKFSNGKLVSTKPWYNLSEQELQISSIYCIIKTDIEKKLNGCVNLYYYDAYNGGSCLVISKPNDWDRKEYPNHFIRLFTCEFKFDKPLNISTVTKTIQFNDNTVLVLALLVESSTGKLKRHILTPENPDIHTSNTQLVDDSIDLDEDHILKLSTYVTGLSKWTQSDFILDVGCGTILEISVLLVGSNPVLFGYLSIS